MRARWLVLALAAALAAVGVAGCGGSKKSSTQTQVVKTVPRVQFIAQGDAICAQNNRLLARIPSPKFNPARPTAAQLRAAAPFLRAEASTVRADVNQVKAIGEPDQGRALFDKGATEALALAAAFDSAAAAASAGDIHGFQAAFAQIRSNTAGKTAKQFGFRVCGHR